MESMNSQEPRPVEEAAELGFGTRLDLSAVSAAVGNIRNEAAKYIIGQQKLIDLMIAAIFSNGHVLIEGVPGIAKTLAAKLISKTLNCEFQRIQFTPDLMPSDVLGTSVFSPKTNDFEFKKGPVFSNIVLIDEINRAPAKTQSALFEVMEERQVTIDGRTYQFTPPFIVFATQNPIEHEGTYSLPEAQVDRFIFKITVDYPTIEEEIRILEMKNDNTAPDDLSAVNPVITPSELAKVQDIIRRVHVEPKIIKYIADIVTSTRDNHSIYLGASPRASISLLYSSKAIAAMNGRDFVIPEDVKFMAVPVLNHRVIPTPDKEMEGIGVEQIINEIIEKIEAPR